MNFAVDGPGAENHTRRVAVRLAEFWRSFFAIPGDPEVLTRCPQKAYVFPLKG